ncbi:hypothetical protein O7598_27565 [Micromonospora sp. WMMC241]|uniref:hypothetical protein n=1 Tax=Micromonospora sp. WMMC241 TaxID=3015159 RepID=UPI0022B6079E|nr:hypothetical protein [Micromonospora sp. WMMC241]MCZ7440190.1 hypothetical protein [Micromonospora sp. WMMC241]
MTVVLTLAAGCTDPVEPASARFEGPPPGSATPIPTPTVDVRAELVEALRRSQGVPHRYAVRGGMPEGKKVRGEGALEPKARRSRATVSITGGKDPQKGSRIVIGTDSWSRESAGEQWVHVDLKRIRRDDPFLRFDWADPTGLKAFATSIVSADRTGPRTYTGRFDPNGKDAKPFLPVGAPGIISLGMPPSPFTVETDARGWVTSISVTLTPSEGPKLALVTTLSGHGTAMKISKPSGAAEAADFYYSK